MRDVVALAELVVKPWVRVPGGGGTDRMCVATRRQDGDEGDAAWPPAPPAATGSELHDLSTAAAWEGLGGLSAGASSRLLFDYAEPARSDLLTLLFSPRSGAANQVCKVEISGDGQSSYGSEPSAMHLAAPASWNFGRGYEHWVLTEARKRRGASLRSAALAWTAPYWVGRGNFLSPGGVDYQVNCMRRRAVEIPPTHALDPSSRHLSERCAPPSPARVAARCAGRACADWCRAGLHGRLE